MTQNNRLELTWVGKEKRAQVEPRILLDDPARIKGLAHSTRLKRCGSSICKSPSPNPQIQYA
jgi:hypothetical protein